MIQGSPEWHAARCGKATASRIADIIARTKSGYSTSRANYAAELVAERLTGEVAAGFSNAAMAWGTEKEPEARAAYSFRSDQDVAEIGFVDHPSIGMAGASPDGLIDDDGLLEIKCPGTAKHIETLLRGDIDGKYITQMQWQMACTGRQWCDFASYDPRMPGAMRLFVKRVPRNEAIIIDMEDAVVAFLKEVADTVSSLRNIYDPQPANDAERLVDFMRAG